MNIVYWIVGIVGAIVLIGLIGSYLKSLPKRRLEAQKKKERWGESVDPVSGISWDLGRTLIDDKRTDSRQYLESLGFKFLGYANEVLLWVEPPAGWTQKWNGHLHTEIFDETGKHRFTYLYKNDIMNMSDYRAELYPAA